jgi:hypothetical protein
MHKRLSFGICENTLKYSYLHERHQCVKWKGAISQEIYAPIGVNIYADNTSQDVPDKSVDVMERKLKDDILHSIEWMHKKFAINLKKTHFMLIETPKRLSECWELCS